MLDFFITNLKRVGGMCLFGAGEHCLSFNSVVRSHTVIYFSFCPRAPPVCFALFLRSSENSLRVDPKQIRVSPRSSTLPDPETSPFPMCVLCAESSMCCFFFFCRRSSALRARATPARGRASPPAAASAHANVGRGGHDGTHSLDLSKDVIGVGFPQPPSGVRFRLLLRRRQARQQHQRKKAGSHRVDTRGAMPSSGEAR